MKPAPFFNMAKSYKAQGSPQPHGSLRRQRGDALLEALVGIVIATIMGLGLSYSASRMMVSQRYVAAQNAVLEQMSNSLSSNGVSNLCGGTSSTTVTVGSSSFAVATPTCTTGTVQVGAISGLLAVTLPTGVVTSMTFVTPSSNTAAENLIGGDGIMTISQ